MLKAAIYFMENFRSSLVRPRVHFVKRRIFRAAYHHMRAIEASHDSMHDTV